MTLVSAAKRRTDARRELEQAAVQLRREIVKAHKRGLTPTQIADEADVSRQTVHTVLRKP